MTFEKELAAYQRELPRLIAESAGRFALVQNDAVSGIFDSYEDAVSAGYERFGFSLFLVKRIESMEPVHHFTRNVVLCRK
jgi:hypothetical protein